MVVRFPFFLVLGASSWPGTEPRKAGLVGMQAGPGNSACHDPPSNLPGEAEHIWLGPRPGPEAAHAAGKGERCLHVAGAPFVFWQE